MNQAHKFLEIFKKSITVLLVTVMLFSCSNNTQKVRDFLAAKNLPTGKAKEAYHVYKDSGRITSKLFAPLMYDFSNRKQHPYSEFPSGIKIINFDKNGKDSVTITGDYALSFSKTKISEIKGNVIVLNHTDNSRLETEQLFWDEDTKYFVSEEAFKLMKENDTIFGIGFECKDDLSKHLSKKTTGKLETSEE
ncbi:LPS export ABC transporter periplasmic protein LptC [Polaribacter sp. MSW13]|uniref:LPS export ABC transporter periplasmic protein LptC n=1 Tax=Polaribacter marinus TaxID=2916838 RepID=A0A9X2AMK8_9FLAO|nr:LPS export ABC transporter periplasmic protein LptC [Polaribacter marinus]MCI2229049.1 LPS export ABC transporter periplasmic protein LptC [Polaribacter marinus]